MFGLGKKIAIAGNLAALGHLQIYYPGFYCIFGAINSLKMKKRSILDARRKARAWDGRNPFLDDPDCVFEVYERVVPGVHRKENGVEVPIRFYVDSRRKFSGSLSRETLRKMKRMSRGAVDMLHEMLYAYEQTTGDSDAFVLNRSWYLQEYEIKVRAYNLAIRELWDNWIAARVDIDGESDVFCLNPKIFWKGNPHDRYPDNTVVKNYRNG